MADAKATVSTRALYTDDELYFLLSWEDPTCSTVKESWQFDGTQWVHLKGDEDRIALLFEITRINQFSSKSCAVVCHSPPDLPRNQWKLATRSPSEKGDLWHWKAARSAPYRHADDGWLTVAGNPSGSYRETGRRYDSGSGGISKRNTRRLLAPCTCRILRANRRCPDSCSWRKPSPSRITQSSRRAT
jgi:hypothetical protein